MFGSGRMRLRRDRPLRDHDRQLAAPAGDDLARHEDVIAEVDELLPRLERLVADRGERHHGLDAAAVARLQRREAQLAGVAAEDDAARDSGGHAGLGACLEVGESLAQRGDRVGDRQRDRIGAAGGIRSLSHQSLALGEANRLLLEDFLVGRLRGRGVGHGAGSSQSRAQVYRRRHRANPEAAGVAGSEARASSVGLAERQPADAVSHRRGGVVEHAPPPPAPAARSGSSPRRAPARRPPATPVR